MSNNIVLVNPHISRMTFDPLTELVPVALLARSPLVILVNQASPIKDVAGLTAIACAEPGAVTYASTGNVFPHHLAMALLARRVNVDLIHVPYRGTGPALTDLIGERMVAMACRFGTALPLIQDRRFARWPGRAPTACRGCPTCRRWPRRYSRALTPIPGLCSWSRAARHLR